MAPRRAQGNGRRASRRRQAVTRSSTATRSIRHDERLPRLARRGVRPLPRRQPAGPGRPVAHRSLKTLSKDDFVKTVRDGRLEKGMVSFAEQQDGDGQHRRPLRVPQGPLERRHHAREGRRAQAMTMARRASGGPDAPGASRRCDRAARRCAAGRRRCRGAGQATTRAPRSARASIRTTCRSRTTRARASRTASPTSSRASSACR